MSNCSANCATVRSPLMATSATFALKAGVWFRRGRLDMVSPDSQATACLPSGRNSTYRLVQISATGSLGRYANHSCMPNAETDTIGHKVIIRAIKNIRTGAEITYNYGRDYFTSVITRRGCKCDKCRKKRADARAKAGGKSRQAHDPDA